jgi:hypothetical protein
MQIDLSEHIPSHFSDNSRVWIYQSSRIFSISEALEIETMLNNFVEQWQTHGKKVSGFANLFFGRFIVLMADETEATVSGCSTDSSVRLIKEIEKTFAVSLFDRQLLAFMMPNNKIEYVPLAQFNHAYNANLIKPENIYFNNTVLTKSDFLHRWMIPVSESWLMGRITARS